MSNGLNKVLIIGSLGSDPEIKYTQAGSPVANLSVATSERWKDKNTGEQKEQVEWPKHLGRMAGGVGLPRMTTGSAYLQKRTAKGPVPGPTADTIPSFRGDLAAFKENKFLSSRWS